MNKKRIRRIALLAWLASDPRNRVSTVFGTLFVCLTGRHGKTLRTRSGEPKGRTREVRWLLGRRLVELVPGTAGELTISRRGRRFLDRCRTLGPKIALFILRGCWPKRSLRAEQELQEIWAPAAAALRHELEAKRSQRANGGVNT